MSTDNTSSLEEPGNAGCDSAALQSLSPDQDNLKNWYQKYMEASGDDLKPDSDVIKVVNSDILDEDFVEKRIKEATPEAHPTKGFCAKCQDLFDNWPTLGGSSTREHDSSPDPGGWEHATARPCSTFELEGSTRSGCRFCAFLLQGLKDIKLLDTFRKIETRLYHLNDKSKLSLSIQNWGGNPLQILWLNFPGKVCSHCNSGIAGDSKFNSAFLPASADCYDDPIDVLDISKKWLSTCSRDHELCKSNKDGTLPTRLLSITDTPTRLVLTSDLPERPRYASLSHSWGGHDAIKLASEKLSSFLKEIPSEGLPKTYTDAIEIARSLGLEYLWIDSLCIIQDSEEDWQKESALMESVYGGSTITIAASSARDSTEGCFLKPPNFSGGLRARITDGGRRRVQDFRTDDVYDLSTFETHLGTRAWALQEKMLPPRTIHFSDRGAFWECRTTIASEYLPDGFPKMLASPLVSRKGKFEWLWPQVVRLYSAANLTYGKDKLPALSGVARLGHNQTGDQYLAGLWRAQVEEQLCWRRWGDHSAKPRPPWRAPSWSWASIDSSVTWYEPQKKVLEKTYAHVLDATMTNYGPDPFGQVTHGVLRLACSVMAAGHLVRSKISEKRGPEPDTTIMLHAGSEKKEFRVQTDCLDDKEQDDDSRIYLVSLLGGRTGSASGRPDSEEYIHELMVQGIVLRSTGRIKGEYSRMGCFNFYKNKMRFDTKPGQIDEEYYDSFLEIIDKYGKSTAEAACAEIISNDDHPDERYVITIV